MIVLHVYASLHHDTVLLVLLLIFPCELAIGRRGFRVLARRVPPQFFESFNGFGEFVGCDRLSQ